MDIKKTALVAFIATIFSLLVPVWNLIQTMNGTLGWRSIPIVLFGLLSGAIIPVFLFALYRNEGTLRIPRSMKVLSKAAALILGLFVVAALRIEFLDPGFTAREGVSDWVGRTIGHILSLLGTFSNATVVLLLVSFNLQTDQESIPDVPGSRFLDQVTKIAVVSYGVALAFLVIRCFLTPYTYSTLKDLALQYGRTPPPFSAPLEEAIRTLVLQACLLTVPFVIFKSMPVVPADDDEPSVSPSAILPNQP